MLAMLLEITSTFSCWAIIPAAATLSERMAGFRSSGPARAEQGVDGLARQVVINLDETLRAVERTLGLDQPRHLEDRLDVGALEHALNQAPRGRQCRLRGSP